MVCQVVLREITPLGLRWQTRVWAPSRRYTKVLYQVTEAVAEGCMSANIRLAGSGVDAQTYVNGLRYLTFCVCVSVLPNSISPGHMRTHVLCSGTHEIDPCLVMQIQVQAVVVQGSSCRDFWSVTSPVCRVPEHEIFSRGSANAAYATRQIRH